MSNEQDKIKELEEKVENLEKEVEGAKGNSETACCCLAAIAAFILLGGGGSCDVNSATHSSTKKSNVLRHIENYQTNISPKIQEKYGDVCRFEPSCSEYAKQAVEKYGSVKGTLMATKRLAKCNPLMKEKDNYDPVD